MKFSERMGLTSKREIQLRSIDDRLRNSLWSALYRTTLQELNSKSTFTGCKTSYARQAYRVWVDYLDFRADEFPDYTSNFIDTIKTYFFKCDWHEVYNVLEAFYSRFKEDRFEEDYHKSFTVEINYMLEKNISGYRLVDGEFSPIIEKDEIKEIQEAASNKFGPVKDHIIRAKKHLSDRKNPDYKNSIKESLSAVESICKIITQDDKATLGKALRVLEREHNLHKSLKIGFSKLYGYSSDADGIRHGAGLTDNKHLKQEDAIYMLVTCSAFVNYLKKKHFV